MSSSMLRNLHKISILSSPLLLFPSTRRRRMWYIIETIQLILYLCLGVFSIAAFFKIREKLNRQAEQLNYYQKRRLEQIDDIPSLQNATETEIFPSKSDSLKKGIRLLSGEKIYLNEKDLAAVIATLQCENDRLNHMDFRGAVKSPH